MNRVVHGVATNQLLPLSCSCMAGAFNYYKGDMLTVRYSIKQCIKNGHLSSDYIVSKVLAIRRKPEQIKLPFEYK